MLVTPLVNVETAEQGPAKFSAKITGFPQPTALWLINMHYFFCFFKNKGADGGSLAMVKATHLAEGQLQNKTRVDGTR